MPKRTDQEIAADWYGIVAEHVIRVVESTATQQGNPLPEASSDHLVGCFRDLRALAIRMQFGPPCRIEVWQGEGEVQLNRTGDDWIVEASCRGETNDGATFDFYQPEGPRRLHLVDGEIWHYLDIDGIGETWFHLTQGGARIVKSLRWLARRVASQQKGSDVGTTPDPNRLVDFRLLAEDLDELDRALQAWNGSPLDPDLRSALEPTLDRLWARLFAGDLNLIGHTASERGLLSRVWSEILWAQRLYESGHAYLEKQAPFPVDPHHLRLPVHAEAARVAAEVASQRDGKGVDGLGSSAKSELDLTVNQRMWAILSEDTSVVEHTARRWADRLGCGTTTVKETKAWKHLLGEREAARNRLPRLSASEAKEAGLSIR